MRYLVAAVIAFMLGFFVLSGLMLWADPQENPVLADPAPTLPAAEAAEKLLRVTLTEIVDAESATAVVADVYLDEELICAAVSSCAFDVLGRGDVRVTAPGYSDWFVAVSAVGGDQIMKGPVRLVPEEAPGVSG